MGKNEEKFEEISKNSEKVIQNFEKKRFFNMFFVHTCAFDRPFTQVWLLVIGEW